MPTAFLRTRNALERDRFSRAALGVCLGLAILGGWAAWCLLGRLTLYEVSDSARIEVDRSPYAVQSPLLGRITASHLATGKKVQADEVLVELEASTERLSVREEQTRLSAVLPEVEALRRQIAAEESAREEERKATQAAIEEAHARARQAEAPAQYNAAEEDRLKRLRESGLIAEREYQKGRADAKESSLNVEREKLAIDRIQREQRTRETDREARIRGLQAEISRLEGQASTSRAAISKLENQIGLRTIRAPISGTLAEAAVLRVGGVLKEGDKIGVIVPDGRMIIVAQFPPPAAMGRLAPGQPAQLRLDGFPWMQWGTVAAKVDRVAGEVRDGTVRVELLVDDSKPSRIPIQHGLPGAVEVAVERVTPATLILRTAGSMLSAPRSAYH